MEKIADFCGKNLILKKFAAGKNIEK